MKPWLRRLLMVVLLAAFLISAGIVIIVRRSYREDEEKYTDAALRFTASAEIAATVPEVTASVAATAAPTEEEPSSAGTEPAAPTESEPEALAPPAPIRVDFDTLQAINPDIVGWIYCPDTVINYPLLQGKDDDEYLHRSYDRSANGAGSIFVEAENRALFTDSTTIIYGHHMRDGSMFASLEQWSDPNYFTAHPVMWILTPDGDWMAELFSGFTTSARSDAYSVFRGPSVALEEYLAHAAEAADVPTEVTLEQDGHYVMLSTCTYVFEASRYVLYGKLTRAGA